jgi:hypothetical protein
MTKKEASARNAAWRAALQEGRVVRSGPMATSYPTVEKAQTALAILLNASLDAEIVNIEMSH